MNAGPAISVVIPAYNAATWIGETLDSVVGQTSPADEIIVVDDGSSDTTADEVRAFGDSVDLVSQANAGCGAAFNSGIVRARGEYIALCPADDLWLPEKLEWQRETLRRHPEVDVSFGGAVNFGFFDTRFAAPQAPGIQQGDEFLRTMFVEDVVPDPSTVFRRELHERLGGFVPEIGEDYEFWMRALVAGAVFHYDPRVMVRLRQHGANLSANAVAIRQMNVRVHSAAADAVGDERLAQRVLARDHATLGRAQLGLNRFGEARRSYTESLRYRWNPHAAIAVTALAVPGTRRVVRYLNRRRGRVTND